MELRVVSGKKDDLPIAAESPVERSRREVNQVWIDQIKTRSVTNYEGKSESPPKEVESIDQQRTQQINIHTICLDAQNEGSPKIHQMEEEEDLEVPLVTEEIDTNLMKI